MQAAGGKFFAAARGVERAHLVNLQIAERKMVADLGKRAACCDVGSEGACHLPPCVKKSGAGVAPQRKLLLGQELM
jgi:hypothetical protein